MTYGVMGRLVFSGGWQSWATIAGRASGVDTSELESGRQALGINHQRQAAQALSGKRARDHDLCFRHGKRQALRTQ